MRAMRRVVRGALLALAGLLAVFVLFAAVFVQPRDGRVRAPDLAGLAPFETRYERKASLLLDALPHSVDADAATLAAARSALVSAIPQAVIAASKRFVSPHQIYASFGEYPYRLEALDAILVPRGATLEIAVPLDGVERLRFAAVAPRSAGALEIRAGERLIASAPIDDAAPAREPGRDWRDVFGVGILGVDRADDLTRWRDVVVTAPVSRGEPVRIRCEGAALGCLVGDVAFFGREREPRENVVVVLVDTMRWDAIERGHAPALARFAAGATRFTQANAPGNMTAPSTNALLSCQKPSAIANVAFAYAVSEQSREAHYAERRPSFPESFARAGYETAMIGNVSVLSEVYGMGVSHGFSRQIAVEVDPFDTPLIGREAIEWLGRNGDAPFLLYVHLHGPHAPYRPTWRDMAETFPGLGALASWPSLMRWLYDGEVLRTDRQIAALLEAIERLGLAGSTTVVFTSDHGDQHAVRSFVGNHAGEDFVGAYFDHGATLYGDEVRVPLVMKRAGDRQARTFTAPVSTLDVGPTLLAWHGLTVPAHCAGISLAPLWSDGAAALEERTAARTIGIEGFRGRALIVGGRWKYIQTLEPTDKRVYAPGDWKGPKRLFLVPEELFDLAADPDETRNLIATEPAVAAHMRAAYRTYFGLRQGFELVVDDPEGRGFAVRVPPGVTARVDQGSATVEAAPDGASVRGAGPTRAIITFDDALTERPAVSIGDARTEVRLTGMGLPLSTPLAELPVEQAGAGSLLPPGRGGGALLRQVTLGQGARRIQAGNPRFEKVLREWGYLNDQ